MNKNKVYSTLTFSVHINTKRNFKNLRCSEGIDRSSHGQIILTWRIIRYMIRFSRNCFHQRKNKSRSFFLYRKAPLCSSVDVYSYNKRTTSLTTYTWGSRNFSGTIPTMRSPTKEYLCSIQWYRDESLSLTIPFYTIFIQVFKILIIYCWYKRLK